MQKHLETAVFLLKITDDPLIFDAVRVFSSPKTPQKVVGSAQKYVENCLAAHNALFTNTVCVYDTKQWYTQERLNWAKNTDFGSV